MEFPYNGIFSPGGFLSTLAGNDEIQIQNSSMQLCINPELIENEITTVIVTSTSEIDQEIQGTSKKKVNKASLNLEPEQNSKIRCGEILVDRSFVIGIDHILEQILSASTTSDLLNFRLVSHRWNSFATPELQNRLTLNFYDYHLTSEKNPEGNGKSLRLLTSLLQNPLSIQDGFPCTKFNFTQTNRISKYLPFPGNLSDTLLESFLSSYGFNITELTLNFSPTFDTYLPRESVVISQIVNLLIFQAPNLKFLSLRLPSKVEWKNYKGAANHNLDGNLNVNFNRGPRSPLRSSDPEFDEINLIKDSLKYQNKSQNFNLQTVKLWDDVSAKILETIIQLCPNLQEIILDPLYYSYLLEPWNRIYFLKTFKVNPCNCDINLLEKIANATENAANNGSDDGESEKELVQGVKLREIFIRIGGRLQLELEHRVANVISRVVNCSFDSLESINWNGVTNVKGLLWPTVMPNVKRIELGNPHDFQKHSLFPVGFSWAKCFPKLKSIRFYDSEGHVDFSDFIRFLNIDERVESVRNVHVVNWNSENSNSVGGHFSVEDSGIIQELFPNAKFIHLWV